MVTPSNLTLVLRMQAVRSFCSYTTKPSTVTLIFDFMILMTTMLPFNEKFKKKENLCSVLWQFHDQQRKLYHTLLGHGRRRETSI